GNIVWSIIEDKKGDLWFGTYGNGVSKYDGKSFTNYTNKEGLSSNYINTILEDKSGNLWFGTEGGGASKYDGKFFTHYTENDGLPNNRVTSILEDKNGNLWFGTSNGLSCLPLTKSTVFSQKVKSNTVSESDIPFKNFSYEDGFLGIGVT